MRLSVDDPLGGALDADNGGSRDQRRGMAGATTSADRPNKNSVRFSKS
jgi:hypothetical protein